jgi:hypothetical protein
MGSVLVTMAQPCFRCWAHKCLVHKRRGYIAPPTAIVNVGRAYLRPGQWWLCATERRLYYRPLPIEALHDSVAVLPTLERLVVARGGSGGGSGGSRGGRGGGEGHGGGSGGPVERLHFEGFSFRHAAWLAPSTGLGYIEDQSGVGVACVLQAKDVRQMAEARGRGLVRTQRIRTVSSLARTSALPLSVRGGLRAGLPTVRGDRIARARPRLARARRPLRSVRARALALALALALTPTQ